MKTLARAAAVLAVAGSVLLSTGMSYAQTAYPTAPVRLVVGYSAGGATDIAARLYADKLTGILGQPVVVENRPGAAGTVAAQEFLNIEPDGHALLVVAASHTFYPLTTRSPVYKLEDFKTIALMGVAPNVFATDPALGVSTFQEFVDLIKANPGKYFHGSSGVGSTSHFSTELFKQLGGLDMVHVPFPGSARALQAVMNGEIALHMDTLSTAKSHHDQGNVRILAIAAAERDPGAPDIPTAEEAGMPGMVSNTYYALVGPRDLPQEIIDKLAEAIAAVRDDEDFKTRMADLMIIIDDASPDETMQFMLNETARWKDVADKAKIFTD